MTTMLKLSSQAITLLGILDGFTEWGCPCEKPGHHNHPLDELLIAGFAETGAMKECIHFDTGPVLYREVGPWRARITPKGREYLNSLTEV